MDKMKNKNPITVIDLGSNTFRLVIYAQAIHPFPILYQKREFLKLPGNGYYAIEYQKPNTQLSILSVHDYPSAKQFVERVKKSQCESYEVADCGTFRTEAYSFTLIPEAKERWNQHMSQHDCSTVRRFTDCDDTPQCSSD